MTPPLADQMKPPPSNTLIDGSSIKITAYAYDMLRKDNLEEQIRSELRAMDRSSGVEYAVSFPM